MSGKLYLVGTPIGNLGDITPRALEVLETVDFIAAEDTRVTLRLLSHFGIKKTLISYHEHNERSRGAQIVQRLLDGESCALVTDAGMPAISDPGEEIVRQCAESGVEAVVVPGPSAVTSAVALSGISGGRFCFEGFLRPGKQERKKHLAMLARESRAVVLYEAPHKLAATLRDLLDALGDRRVALCRELTKLHEEVWHTTLSEAVAYYAETAPRGEFVLVIEGAPDTAQDEAAAITFDDALALTRELHAGGIPLSQAAREAAQRTGHQKGALYRAATQPE